MARGSVNAALQEPAPATFMSCTRWRRGREGRPVTSVMNDPVSGSRLGATSRNAVLGPLTEGNSTLRR